MIRLPVRSVWSRWIGYEFLQWILAFVLFFGLPWAHYRQILAPQLQPVQQLRETLDQEWRQAIRRGDWERWAGEAMARVQTAVHRAMKQKDIPPDSAPVAAQMPPDSLKHAMSSVKTVSKTHTPSAQRRTPSKNILLRVPGVGPDDIVWTALNDFYAAPYLWGGDTVFGVDCSGLVTQVFHRVGVVLPRTAQTQFDSRLGVYVGLDDLKPGDLVFFHTRRTPYVSHVGIYIGHNEFVHAPRAGHRVDITPLTGFYKKRFIAGKRIIADPFERFVRGET